MHSEYSVHEHLACAHDRLCLLPLRRDEIPLKTPVGLHCMSMV